MATKYAGAIYIIGPNNENNYNKKIDLLKDKFKKVIVIGNGRIDILDKNGNGPLLDLRNLYKDNPDFSNEDKFLIYVDMHGISIENTHYLSTTYNSLMLTKDFFNFLSETIINPVDIIFEPCNGKAAINDINSLRLNSEIIIFSETDASTISPNIEITMDSMDPNEFSISNFYNNYLARMFSLDENPIIHVVGKKTIDPLLLSKDILGKSISEGSRQYVHNNFGKDICKDDPTCHSIIDLQMDKIENIKSIDEFKSPASGNYFDALKEYVRMKVEYSYTRNSNYEIVAKYNHYTEESCYIDLLNLKYKADQLFIKYEIPLKLDLSELRLQVIEVNYDKEEILEELQNLSDSGIYNLIKSDGFIENDNFSQPSYEEYGLTLGIIVDIYQSLSLTDN